LKLNIKLTMTGGYITVEICHAFFRRLIALLLTLAIISPLSACAWVGETAGRARAGIEGAFKNTKEGYHRGYEEGRRD
jgi:hypothetical protein